jgi:hypothetical protein
MFKQTNKIKLALTGVVLSVSAVIANATPLVTNGDFSGGGTGWNSVGTSNDNYFTVDDGPAPIYYWANGETSSTPGSISQTLVTDQFHNYNLSFYVDMAGTNSQSFNVEWNGQNLFASDLVGNANPFNVLSNNSYSFYGLQAASGASTTLRFFGINANDYNYLTDVVVTDVPEPESLAIMLLGLPMIAWTTRRRKG